MLTMYETIMELPLFKGLGTEQISKMLEKTTVEFLNLKEGEELAHPFMRVNNIDFILGGSLSRVHYLQNLKITVEEILNKGSVVGAGHLFGISTNYGCDIKAIEKTNLLRINKNQYLNILNSDRIFLLNYLNYLSAAAQRPSIRLMETENFNIFDHLMGLVLSVASPLASKIIIKGQDSDLALFCGVNTESFIKWKKIAQGMEKIELINEGLIIKNKRGDI